MSTTNYRNFIGDQNIGFCDSRFMSKTENHTPISEWASREFFRVKSERGVTQTDLGRALGISQPQARGLIVGSRTIKAHEIPMLEKFFGASYVYQAPVPDTAVPLISWVSAGQLTEQTAVTDLGDYPKFHAADLPPGEWVALRVDGSSMNKISPPDSIVLVNTADTNLVANGLYIVADETGQATYKRYEPEKNPPFQPASYKDVEPPHFEGVVRVIGRVRRSIIDT